MFLDPDFRYDTKMSAIRVHLRNSVGLLIFEWIFRTSWPKVEFFGGQNGGKGSTMLTSNELVFTSWGFFTSMPILVKIDQEMRP